MSGTKGDYLMASKGPPPEEGIVTEPEKSSLSPSLLGYSSYPSVTSIVVYIVVLAVIGVGSYLSYAVLTRPASEFIVGRLLIDTSPFVLASLGVFFGFGLSVCGAGLGILITGASLVGAAVRVPRVRTKNLVSIIFCEASAIYGVIASFIIYSKMAPVQNLTASNLFTGYALFWSGVTVGVCNFICGITVGLIGSVAVLADAHNSAMFVKILVIEIFASAISLFGVIAGCMQCFRAEKLGP